ncbi:MAG: SpoIVB peptidase S55 domain-containing protein, partial [Gemmataceae bacterium]
PMYVGYVHTVYPRLTVSFKMGSPLREVGTIDADVSTCIAGVIGKKADTLPLSAEVTIGKGETRAYHVRLGRHESLLPSLVATALTNAADTEGELPEQLTARMRARITLEGGRVLTVEDTFSGFSGGRAPAVLYNPIAGMVSHLVSNPFEELHVKRIDCVTRVEPGRASADIEAVEPASAEYAAGDTVRVNVTLKPYRGPRRRVVVELKLPDDLPPGDYTALVADEPSSARQDVRNHPGLLYPTSADQVLDALDVLTRAKRTTLTVRLPLGAHGVVSGGRAMPTLPGSMVHILAGGKKSGTLPLARAAVAKKDTEWVIQGSETVTFTVTKVRKLTRGEGDN